MKVSQRIYLTEDRQRAVPAGDPAARFLFASAGEEVSDARIDSVEGARELAGEEAPAESSKEAPKAPKAKKARAAK